MVAGRRLSHGAAAGIHKVVSLSPLPSTHMACAVQEAQLTIMAAGSHRLQERVRIDWLNEDSRI